MKRVTRCVQHQDKKGCHWTVPEDNDAPEVEVWWNRSEGIEELVIRQENGATGVDAILLSPGQVYDLIDAITRAVENP